jgi:hypothetical protein
MYRLHSEQVVVYIDCGRRCINMIGWWSGSLSKTSFFWMHKSEKQTPHFLTQ